MTKKKAVAPKDAVVTPVSPRGFQPKQAAASVKSGKKADTASDRARERKGDLVLYGLDHRHRPVETGEPRGNGITFSSVEDGSSFISILGLDNECWGLYSQSKDEMVMMTPRLAEFISTAEACPGSLLWQKAAVRKAIDAIKAIKPIEIVTSSGTATLRAVAQRPRYSNTCMDYYVAIDIPGTSSCCAKSSISVHYLNGRDAQQGLEAQYHELCSLYAQAHQETPKRYRQKNLLDLLRSHFAKPMTAAADSLKGSASLLPGSPLLGDFVMLLLQGVIAFMPDYGTRADSFKEQARECLANRDFAGFQSVLIDAFDGRPGFTCRYGKSCLDEVLEPHIASHHHGLLDHINASACDSILQVDFHSDLADFVGFEATEGDFLTFVKNREQMDYHWFLPNYHLCHIERYGHCDNDNVFAKGFDLYRTQTIHRGTRRLPWKGVVRVGISLSPNWVYYGAAEPIIEKYLYRWADPEVRREIEEWRDDYYHEFGLELEGSRLAA